MSSTELKQVNGKLVEKILAQGQKLRNAMVQSILQNDPLNSEIIYDKHFNTPICSATTISDKKSSNTNLLEAFLNGDYLTKDEEETALNTIRTMSVSDVCKTTEKTLLSKCSCSTCNAYNMNNLKCDLRRTDNFKEKCISNYIKQKNWGSDHIIKYADTLKVILQSIHLNNLGNKKVTQGANTQFRFGINETYFVEYYIPELFTKEMPKSISKIDSGLECNHVRVCARRTSEDAVLNQKLPSDDTDSGEEYKDVDASIKSNTLKKAPTPEKKIENKADKETKKESIEDKPLKGQQSARPPLTFSKSVGFIKNKDVGIATTTSVEKLDKVHKLKEDLETVPLLHEDDILLKLRENFMVIEFWEKQDQTDLLFGLTRLPLHQFYLAYRNTIILQHLKRNKLPIIGTDWWEPIYSTDSNEFIGQVQVLTALGTEGQIRNLELERGFKDDVVKAKFPSSTQVRSNVKVRQTSSYFTDRAKVFNKQPKIVFNKAVNTLNTVVNSIRSGEPSEEQKPQKLDVGVQSDMDVRMTSKDNSQNLPQIQEMLSSFMKMLEQRPVRMENSTNTEPTGASGPSTQIPLNTETEPLPQIRKTSELLDSLQKVLTIDNKPIKKLPKLPSFNVQIIINGANQLPSRRKIKNKSKRIKGKSPKQEENIFPSTYVSFETMPGDPLQVTNVFPKSTSPQWNYTCEVNLPLDLLTNGQKRLIFKVWKKCTNAVLQPNMQADVVLGFAAVDLSVLLAGLPNIQGWFNIVDFSGKCNGQINIHVNPLENVSKACSAITNFVDAVNSNTALPCLKPEKEDCDELLSRALKRKFTELDEITQRLRLRDRTAVPENGVLLLQGQYYFTISNNNTYCGTILYLERGMVGKSPISILPSTIKKRLSEVVSEDSEGSNDEIAEEFENDINNLCIEEDFDLINFEEEARKFNATLNNQKPEGQGKQSSSHLLSVTSEPGSSEQLIRSDQEAAFNMEKLKAGEKLELDMSELLVDKDDTSDNTESSSSKSSFMDKHIMQGKQRIDTLLEKLSLINAEASQPFSSRYVSGCSVSNETADARNIMENLNEKSRPNIRSGSNYDPLMLEQLYGGSMGGSHASSGNLNSDSNSNSNSNSNLDTPLVSGSDTSVITNFSECRPNPDGQGTNSDDRET